MSLISLLNSTPDNNCTLNTIKCNFSQRIYSSTADGKVNKRLGYATYKGYAKDTLLLHVTTLRNKGKLGTKMLNVCAKLPL